MASSLGNAGPDSRVSPGGCPFLPGSLSRAFSSPWLALSGVPIKEKEPLVHFPEGLEEPNS